MKISFTTLGCPRWSWKEITATAYDLGYNGVEVRGVGDVINVPSIPAFSDANLEKTKAELTRLNLQIPCLDSDCCIHLRETEHSITESIKAHVILAEKLHTPYVRIMAAAPVPQPTGEIDEAYVRDRIIELAHFAAQHGIKLLIETHGVWCDSERLARLLSTIACDSVGALWDMHHPYRFMGEKPSVTIQNLRPWLCHTHIKDSSATDDGYRYALPGFGDLPLEEMICSLRDAGYDGFYSLEWVKRWDMTLEEPGIVFAHYANYIRSI